MTVRDQLKDFRTADLAAEVARRLAERRAKTAGGDQPPRKRFATKAEWAQDQANQFKRTLEQLQMERAPDGSETQRKVEQMAILREQITKYEGMAKAYTRRGE